MSGPTGIAWTDTTWNPVRGCSRVSEGCRNCYAEKIAGRFSDPGKPFEGFARQSPARWTGKVELVPEKLEEPLHWRKPRRVFVNSMSDLFHEKLKDEEIDLVFAAMAQTWWHTFQVLTKRPSRALAYLGNLDAHLRTTRCFRAFTKYEKPVGPWPLPNVWLGVSVEDQKTADERIPLLLDTPAAIRFVSAEPLLGRIRLRLTPGRRVVHCPACKSDRWQGIGPCAKCGGAPPAGIGWVIVGGESGPGARPFDVEWARDVVEECRAARVSCFVKQVGANVRDRNDAGFEADLETWADGPNAGRPTEPRAWPCPLDVEHDPVDTNYQGAPVRIRLRDRAGADPDEWPEDLRVREFPEVSRG